MAILLRKIERNKWVVDEHTEYANADVLSKCLFTHNNELSLWAAESVDDVDESIVAMVSGQDHIQRTHVVLLNVDDLRREEVEIVETPGAAASQLLSMKHRDLARLNVKSMLSVSTLIVSAIKDDAKVRSLTERQVKDLMQKAFDDGRLDPDLLKHDVRKKIDKAYASSLTAASPG